MHSIRTLSALVALTFAIFVLRASCFQADDDEHPCIPEYESSLDTALLVAGVSSRERKSPAARKPLQGILPLCLTANLPPEYGIAAAVPVSSDEDPMRAQALTQLGFGEAASVWLETRRPYISDETFRNYKIYAKILTAFFGEMKLQEIDGDLVRAFQKARLVSVSPSEINKECTVLIQMRKRIGMPLGDYQPLPVKKESPGRPLTPEEDKKLSVAGKFQDDLEPAHLFVLISKNTGAGPKEVRGVRLKDINLEERLMYVPRSAAKNDHRMREVPLNEIAFPAICRAIELAIAKGSREPEHYLFPFCVKRHQWDPTRPQTTFRKAWAKICELSGIKHLRMYDLRHHAATNMLSDPSVPPEAAIEVLGHVSKQMLKRYCHLNREAKRAAVDALARKKPSSVQIPSWLLKKG